MNKFKTLYIIAGANGSGKTTFALSYAELNNLHFINADEIAKKYEPTNIQKYKVKAGKEFFRQLGEYLNKDESFIIETTLSGKYIIKMINEAKIKNFKVVLIYLYLEAEIENILRVKNRVLNGGHEGVTSIECKGLFVGWAASFCCPPFHARWARKRPCPPYNYNIK